MIVLLEHSHDLQTRGHQCLNQSFHLLNPPQAQLTIQPHQIRLVRHQPSSSFVFILANQPLEDLTSKDIFGTAGVLSIRSPQRCDVPISKQATRNVIINFNWQKLLAGQLQI